MLGYVRALAHMRIFSSSLPPSLAALRGSTLSGVAEERGCRLRLRTPRAPPLTQSGGIENNNNGTAGGIKREEEKKRKRKEKTRQKNARYFLIRDPVARLVICRFRGGAAPLPSFIPACPSADCAGRVFCEALSLFFSSSFFFTRASPSRLDVKSIERNARSYAPVKTARR